MIAEFGPLDACLKAAAIRDDRDMERSLEGALAELSAPRRQQPDTLTAARWYVSLGLHVFPLQDGSKRPMPGSHGLHDATLNQDVARSWFHVRRVGPVNYRRNIGITTGGLFDVIDIDGSEGVDSFINMIKDGATWLHIRGITQTPRGVHLWVPATGQGNRAYSHGIDYRGLGGYVVVPPSVVDGITYRWLMPPSL